MPYAQDYHDLRRQGFTLPQPLVKSALMLIINFNGLINWSKIDTMARFIKFHDAISPNAAPLPRSRHKIGASLKGSIVAAFSLIVSACGQNNDADTNTIAAKENNGVDAAISQDTATVAETPSDPITLGKKVFRSCTSCHTADKEGKNRVGPNLYGIFGAKAATREGFAYSKALLNSEIIWDDQTLDGFLLQPSKYIPNNRMSFGGVRNDEKRANLIAYLKSLKDEPAE